MHGRFRFAGISILAFPGLAFAIASISAVWPQPFFLPSLFPLLFWPIGVLFLVLFVVSGVGLLGERRWAARLAIITLALLLIAEWTTCLAMLTPVKWLSLSGPPALGWLVLAVLGFGAVGLLTGRRWMVKSAALALPVLAIVLLGVGFALLMISEPGGGRSMGAPPPRDSLPVAVTVTIAVVTNSLLLAYPVAMLAAFARWRLQTATIHDSDPAQG